MFSKNLLLHLCLYLFHQLLSKCKKTHLINKESCHKFSWLENLYNFSNQVIVRGLTYVCFKTNIRKLWFWSDVNSPVSSLKKNKVLLPPNTYFF